MEKEFIHYEMAVKLKSLGFNEPCLAWYGINNILFSDITIGYEAMDSRYIQEDMNTQQCTAPTFSQAFRWFREKYDYCSYVKEATKGTYRFYIEKFDEKSFCSDRIETYEEAEIACLDKLIDIVESKSAQNNDDGRSMEKLIESNRKFDEKNNHSIKYDSSDRNEDTPNITNFFI